MSHSDGSIIVDTELDTEGFRAGSKELDSAVKSLNKQVEGLGPTFKKAMSGGIKEMENFDLKAGALENTITTIEQKMSELGSLRIPTEEYKQVTDELEKTSKQFDRLLARQEKMEALGVDKNSMQWRSLQYDMEQVSNLYHRLLEQKRQLESSGSAFTSGGDTSQYAAMANALAAAKQSLLEMQTAAHPTANTVQRIAQGAKNVFSWMGKAASTVKGKVVSGLKNALAATKKLVSANRTYKNSFSGVLSQIKRIAPALLAAEGVLGVLRKAVNAYMESNQELATTLNRCWASIGNLLGPIITRLVDLTASAVSYFTSFLKLLGFTGGAAASAIGNAGGAAKKETDKLKRQLASFDELNVLGNQSSSDGGETAVELLPDKQLPDWAQTIANQLKNGNWKGAAITLTDQLNGMVNHVDWKGVGQKIGKSLDGALTFLATAIKTFDWKNLGTKLAACVNEILTTVDWKNFGTILVSGFKIILETAAGFIANLDWYALANAIFDALVGIWQAIDWSAVVSGLFQGLGGALGGLGRFLLEKIQEAFIAIRDAVREKAAEHGGNIVLGIFQGIIDAIAGVAKWIYQNIFRPFIDGFKNAFGIHSPSTVMAEQGGFLIEGLLQGIMQGWKSILTFVSDSAAELANLLSQKWSSMITDAKAKWSTLRTNVVNAASNMRTNLASNFREIVSNAQTSWSNLHSCTMNKFSTLRSNVINAWVNLRTNMNNIKWNNVGHNLVAGLNNGISGAWGGLMNNVSTMCNNLIRRVRSTFGVHSPSKIFEAIGKFLDEGLIQGLKSGEGSLLKTAKNIATAVTNGMTPDTPEVQMRVDDAAGGMRSVISSLGSLTTIFQAIANALTSIGGFTMPNIAFGTVVPYQTKTAAAVPVDDENYVESYLLGILSELQALSRSMQNGDGNQNGDIRVIIGGREVFQVVVEENNRAIRTTGTSPLKV